MPEIIVADLLIILTAGLAAGLLCRRIGVSLLVGYILAGALIGGGGLHLIPSENRDLEHLAQVGVLFLLYSIGLEFSLDRLARSARYLLVGGTIQMLVVAIPVALVGHWLGASWQKSWLIGFTLAMSSTVVVFKALAERGQTASPAGERSIAILLAQDIAAVPLLLLIPLLTGQGDQAGLGQYARLAAVSMALIVGVLALRMLLDRWVIPWLAGLRSTELVMLFALVILAGVCFVTYRAGLPAPLGAMAAGLVLGGNRLTGQVDALVLPFRETFAAVFFVSLGLLFEPTVLLDQPWLLALALVGVLGLKWGSGWLAARATGLGSKAALAVGLSVAQIGEFAFVLAFAGWSAGLIGDRAYQRILAMAIASLVLTPVLLQFALGWLKSVPRTDRGPQLRPPRGQAGRPIALVVGIGPVGKRICGRLREMGYQAAAIDLSPVNLQELAQQGYPTVAGDARDPEVLERALCADTHIVVVSVPVDDVAGQVVSSVRRLNRDAIVLVRCRYLSKVAAMHKAGATAVISEEAEATEQLLNALATLDPLPVAGPLRGDRI